MAAVTPLEIRVIAAGLSPAVPGSLTTGALKSPWVLQPVFDGFSILSPSWLWVEMPLMLLLTALFTWAVSGRRLLRVRRVPAWRSATVGVEFTNTAVSTTGDGSDVSSTWEATHGDNPHIRYHSNRRGYIACTATPAQMRADFKILDKVTVADLPARIGGSLVVMAGRSGSQTD